LLWERERLESVTRRDADGKAATLTARMPRGRVGGNGVIWIARVL
jgi:hypothetical protein